MSEATIPAPPDMKTLSIEIDGDLGVLTLERPDALNAMSPEMIFELTVAAGWLADQAPLRGARRDRRRRARVQLRRRRRPGFAVASRTPRSTCRRTSGAAPRSCTRRSSTSAASRIR